MCRETLPGGEAAVPETESHLLQDTEQRVELSQVGGKKCSVCVCVVSVVDFCSVLSAAALSLSVVLKQRLDCCSSLSPPLFQLM